MVCKKNSFKFASTSLHTDRIARKNIPFHQERRDDQIAQLPKIHDRDFLKREKVRRLYRTSMVGWTHIKRMRALLIVFMFVVVVVATGSWLVHSLLIQVVLSGGSQHLQVNHMNFESASMGSFCILHSD